MEALEKARTHQIPPPTHTHTLKLEDILIASSQYNKTLGIFSLRVEEVTWTQREIENFTQETVLHLQTDSMYFETEHSMTVMSVVKLPLAGVVDHRSWYCIVVP